MKEIKFIEDVVLEGRRVLTRLDLNVPLDNNAQITDDSRIKSSLKTIRYIIDKGGKAILMSHLGRPNGERLENMSLKPVSEALSVNLGKNVIFAQDCVGNKVEKIIYDLNGASYKITERTPEIIIIIR